MTEKKNDDIKIEYVIKNLSKAEDENKSILMTLEPVEKPKNQPKINTDVFSLLGMDKEDSESLKKLGEGFLGDIMKNSSLYQIPITPSQLKKLGKTIGDKVTISVQ